MDSLVDEMHLTIKGEDYFFRLISNKIPSFRKSKRKIIGEVYLKGKDEEWEKAGRFIKREDNQLDLYSANTEIDINSQKRKIILESTCNDSGDHMTSKKRLIERINLFKTRTYKLT